MTCHTDGPAHRQVHGGEGLPGPWSPPFPPGPCRGLSPTHRLTFPAGGGALCDPQLFPVVIPAPPRGLWCWGHRVVWLMGSESVRVSDWEGLRGFRGEDLLGFPTQVLLLLAPVLLLSAFLAHAFCFQLAIEWLPWDRPVTHTHSKTRVDTEWKEGTASTLDITECESISAPQA